MRSVGIFLTHDWKTLYKNVLREAQRGVVPDEVRTRPKNDFAFDGFFYELLRKNMDYLRSLLSDFAAANAEIIKGNVIDEFDKLLFGMHSNSVQKLSQLIAYALWERDFMYYAQLSENKFEPQFSC